MRKLTKEEYQAIEYADGVGLNVPEFVEIREGDECWRPDDITPEENEELARLLLLYQLRQQNAHLEEQNKILEDTYKKTAGIKGWVSFFAFLVIVSLILSFFSWVNSFAH